VCMDVGCSESTVVVRPDPVTVGAVIFDMDGLMFDTERVAQVAWYRAMADYGFVITDDVYAAAIGRTAPDTRAIFVAALGAELPIGAIEATMSRYLRELLEPAPPLKQGLLELLDEIERLGLRAAVASSTARSEVRRRVEACGLEDRFDVVVGGDDVVDGKPAPDLFLQASRLLHVEAADCVVLEDSEPGIRAASAAGMRAVLVPDMPASSSLCSELATCVVSSLSEVGALLRDWQSART
jgi:HAD superfamily hydrolase (TIGR01509 family)